MQGEGSEGRWPFGKLRAGFEGQLFHRNGIARIRQQVPPLRLKPSVGMTLQERVAGCAQEDSDRGDVTARLTPRPFKKQIPRGLKPARDDK